MLSTSVTEMTTADNLLAFNIREVTTKWKTIRNAELSLS